MQFPDIEAYPLFWPDGWIRTRPQNRRSNRTWKKPFGAYRDDLIHQVELLRATTLTISTNVPLTLRGLPREGFNPPDPGVAVYFGRETKGDLPWQDVLGLESNPTSDQIEQAVRKYSKLYYPDVPGTGDAELFRVLMRARDQARNWLAGRRSEEHTYVLACDLFREVRLNLHAIALTIEAMRQIERCGASSMLERAFRGFMKALPAQASSAMGR